MPSGIYKHKKGYRRPEFSSEWKANLSKARKGKLSGSKNPAKRREVRDKISEALKGNQNSKGAVRSVESIKKTADALRGEKNGAWKGGGVSYRELHKWIRKNKKLPVNCSHCGEPKRLEWANVDGKYRRELDDFIALCRRCHWKYDHKQN